MKIYYKNWRLFLIFLFLFLSIAAIVSRMVYIQVEQGNFLLQKGNNQNTSERVIKFKRDLFMIKMDSSCNKYYRF